MVIFDADNPLEAATAKEYLEQTTEFEQTCKDYVLKYALKPPQATYLPRSSCDPKAAECSPEGAPEATQMSQVDKF